MSVYCCSVIVVSLSLQLLFIHLSTALASSILSLQSFSYRCVSVFAVVVYSPVFVSVYCCSVIVVSVVVYSPVFVSVYVVQLSLVSRFTFSSLYLYIDSLYSFIL